MTYRDRMTHKTFFSLVVLWALIFPLLFSIAVWSEEDSKYTERRNHLVKRYIEDRGIQDPDVLRAMYMVPRHEFVPEDLWNRMHLKDYIKDYRKLDT